MRRLAVCLLIAMASAGAAARESKLADAGGSCPGNSNRPAASRAVSRDAAVSPVPATKTRVGAQGGGDDGGRLQSPRWHRFLPGMFR